MNRKTKTHPWSSKELPPTPPPTTKHPMADKQDTPPSPSISEPSIYSQSSASPESHGESRRQREVILSFHWAQFLAPYDQLAEAHFELPRVPTFRIDPQTRTIHDIKPQTFGGQQQAQGAVVGEADDEYADVIVIDREAVEATKRAEELKEMEDMMKRAALAKTPSVRRTIVRRKLS